MTGGFVVTVSFSIKTEYRTDFRRAVSKNAADSLKFEPGCRLFEVCEANEGSEIFLYELYDHKAAFDAHLATEHFRSFDRIVSSWVIDKRVTTYAKIGSEGRDVSLDTAGRPN
ncbi:putative quinol monooxygenase [Bradyrhizobium sp. PRIMUS42]|uniref:putative quinol monooxygenase n=1 Tax=Bradyrhizobium sp. PRIMUS42 TaxID=2908926 RepID=UPI001FF43878|nr:antibiotic biosynthesis monooxygenase family protein [Bradyrhizobium sp. PRIMUS42]MCJ9728600.1 antibiotic biosynthesis monooxygenase [Bradyrhizobium sp. PRIMUS42]